MSTSKWPSEPYYPYKYQCSYFNGLQSCDLKRKFMTFRPVANLMHHPICCNFFMDRWPLVTVHKSEETIQGRKLFKGGNNIVMQSYNCTTILWNSDPLHIFQSMAAKVALFLFSVSGTFSTEFERKQSLSSRLAYESTFVCKEEVLGLKKFIGHFSG